MSRFDAYAADSARLRANYTSRRPGLIRAVLVIFALIFAWGFADGVTQWGDRRAQCPKETLIQSINPDGSIDCVLKIDRDPAKVTKRWRIPT